MDVEMNLDILLLKDSSADAWTSQCLQYDIAGQGKTIKESLVAFGYALTAEVAYGVEFKQQLDDPLEGIAPAPDKFQRLFAEAGATVVPAEESPFPDVPEEIRAVMPTLRELRAA